MQDQEPDREPGLEPEQVPGPKLDEIEDGLIARLDGHPVLARLTELGDGDLAAVLLQRRFVSLAFTPVYDLAIDLLQDEVALRIVRSILREEYPDGSGHTRSHREDMKDDLLSLGVTRRALVESSPTPATRRTIADTFALVAEAGRRDDADLRLVTFLRFWGEILVAVEYGRLWPRMAPAFATGTGSGNSSRFYYPHLVHDAKAHPLSGISLLSTTHSDRLATRLADLLARAPSTAPFEEVEDRAVGLKESFYDQFLPRLDRDLTGR